MVQSEGVRGDRIPVPAAELRDAAAVATEHQPRRTHLEAAVRVVPRRGSEEVTHVQVPGALCKDTEHHRSQGKGRGVALAKTWVIAAPLELRHPLLPSGCLQHVLPARPHL